MDTSSGRVIDMACLGRPFRLGMLYDCRSDKLIPGITLWDDEKLKSALDSREQIGSDFEIIAEDSLQSKASKLDINASLKLSFMGGLVKVSGSAKYLNDRKSSKHQSRVSLKYWSTSRFDQLTMEQLGNIQYPEVLHNKIATHIVAGVLYGADAFFVFDRRVEESESMQNVQGKVEALIKAMPGLPEIKGDADVDMNEEDKKEADRLECKFYGDLQLPSNPTTFVDAVQVFQQLPDLLKGDDGPVVVPKKVWLHPLSNLSSKAAKVIHEVSTSLVLQAQKVLEELHEYDMQCNDLLNTQVCFSFSSVQNQLSDFKGMILQYRLEFSKKLTGLLPSIREGGMEESQLADVLKSRESSPFSTHKLQAWLQLKEREISILGKYFEALRDVDCIEFTLRAGSLDRIINDLNYDHVVCFSFQMLMNRDPRLDQMQDFLEAQTFAAVQEVSPWFENKQIMSTMRKQVRQFMTFAKANEERDRVKFVVAASSSRDGDKLGTAILLFEDGIASEFDPPVSPDSVKACPDDITDSSICVEWSKPKYGSECVRQYGVCYGHKDQPPQHWNTKKTAGKETSIILDGLESETSYCVKVRAVCEAGVSEYSQVSNPIITLQSPDTNHLATALKSTCILLPNEGGPSIYQLVGKETESLPPLATSRRIHIGEPFPGVPEKVVMVVGATGVGKTTLINSMVNYIFGVQWNDTFRFKLATEEKSDLYYLFRKTSYTIHHMEGSKIPYSLTVIDTPGFTEDSSSSMNLTSLKEFLLSTDVSHLDAIAVVTPSPTPFVNTTLCTLSRILSLFGKDMASNVFMMVTFADGQKPPVLTAIEDGKIPYSECFKFNHSALYADIGENEENKVFWKMSSRSLEKFFEAVQTRVGVGLAITRDVLEQRDKLHVVLTDIQRINSENILDLSELMKYNDPYHYVESGTDPLTAWEEAEAVRRRLRPKLEKAQDELKKYFVKAEKFLKKLDEIAMIDNCIIVKDYLDTTTEQEKADSAFNIERGMNFTPHTW